MFYSNYKGIRFAAGKPPSEVFRLLIITHDMPQYNGLGYCVLRRCILKGVGGGVEIIAHSKVLKIYSFKVSPIYSIYFI